MPIGCRWCENVYQAGAAAPEDNHLDLWIAGRQEVKRPNTSGQGQLRVQAA
jgi:hypothetical protein